MKTLIHYAAGIIFSLCLMVTLLITSVEAVVYWTPGYFEKEYAKYNVTEAVDMTMEDLLDVTDQMMAYLRGKRADLHVDTTMGGVSREFFNEREIAHKDFLLLDFAGFAIDETDVGEQGSLVGDVFFFALVDGVFRVAEFMCAELDVHIFRGAFDGAHVVECFGDSFIHEPLEAIRLDGDQVGHIHDVGNLRKAATFPIKAGGSAVFCFGHRSSFR